ncbi:hypothetical protein CCHL11_09160 [Colletotrichum chlorophyti]|uniref:Secreted protein n=1 Tax=Colletotrichum chlorophyti TaxID=708187 RepID=A0A1Q8S8F1_9PEZI|nr:hypothetical protein CCHL11_09160 [Colletotrichum chlorophyti]
MSLFRLTLLLVAAALSRADSSACKLPAIPDVHLSSGFIDKANYDCAPSTGTLRGLIIFVDFSDEPATETAKDLYDIFFPGTPNWYDISSYGKLALNITADTSTFHQMPKSAAAYHFDRGYSYEEHLGYILDAFNAWEKSTNTPIPNGSEPLTDVLYIITTTNAKSISTSATLSSSVRDSNNNFIAKRAVTLGPEDPDIWPKVLEHETGHAICLPDMYPLTSEDNARWAGNWDLMATLQGQSQDFFAWNKWRLGWLTDDQVECVSTAGSTTHKLTPLEKPGGVKAVVVKKSETEALVAEVRSKGGVDTDLCSSGVLLYTVSTEVATGQGPFRVVDGNPGRSATSGCGENEFDDAPLSLTGVGASSARIDAFGVTITITEQNGDEYTIRVDQS